MILSNVRRTAVLHRQLVARTQFLYFITFVWFLFSTNRLPLIGYPSQLAAIRASIGIFHGAPRVRAKSENHLQQKGTRSETCERSNKNSRKTNRNWISRERNNRRWTFLFRIRSNARASNDPNGKETSESSHRIKLKWNSSVWHPHNLCVVRNRNLCCSRARCQGSIYSVYRTLWVRPVL